MADKEVTVKIKPVVDDDSEVKDLESLIKEMDNTNVHIPVETEASSWYDLQAKIEELENEKILINMGVLDGDVDEVQSKIDDLKQQQIDLTVNTDDSSVDDAGDKVDDLDGSTPEVTADTDDSSVDDAEDKVDNLDGKEATVSVGADTSSAEESIRGLEEALTAVGAGAALAGMEQMVSTADNINQSWDRLSLTLGRYGVNVDDIKAKQNELTTATGRTGSEFRNFANTMSLAGIHDLDVIGDAFEAASAGAMKTNSSVEQVANSFQRMAMQGTVSARVLKNSGVEMEDLARVLGVSVDQVSEKFKSLTPEERLKALSSAMVNAKDANDMYKNSLQSMKAQADAAFAGLMGAVGNMILPFLIPAMKVATQAIEALSAGFKALPAPIQGVIGGVLAVVMGFLALTTIVGTIQAVATAINFVQTAMNIWNAVTRVATAVQAALNAVMMMNPYVLIAVAIIALIAALWYLYNTNESVRNAIDGFGQALWGLGEAIYSGIAGAIQWLIDGFTWLYETISGLFTTTGSEGINWLTTMMMVMMGPIGWIVLLIQHWNQIAPAVSGALSAMYQNAVTWFNQTGARIHSFASDLVSTIGSAAWNAVSSFAAGIIGIASAIAGELDRAWSTVVSWGQQLIQRFWQIAVDAVNALKKGLGIGSPGFMYYMVEGELNRIDDLAKYTDMPSSFGTLANDMVNNFNPQFSNGSSSAGAGGVVNNFNFTFTDFIDGKERLIDLIIRTITDEIEWDNDRANRTV